MTKNKFGYFLGLLLLSLSSCGPAHHVTYQAPVTVEVSYSLADNLWTFSQTHPDGFTVNIHNWQEPKEGIVVAYSATQDRHDRADLDFVVTHAQSNDGFVGGWLNTESGRYYFDSVRLFPEDSLEQAIRFGRENAQIAIFILSKGKEVLLEY